MTVETGGSQKVVGMSHEEWMEDGYVEFDVTEMAGTLGVELLACPTDIFRVKWAKSWVVETSGGRYIVVIE